MALIEFLPKQPLGLLHRRFPRDSSPLWWRWLKVSEAKSDSAGREGLWSWWDGADVRAERVLGRGLSPWSRSAPSPCSGQALRPGHFPHPQLDPEWTLRCPYNDVSPSHSCRHQLIHSKVHYLPRRKQSVLLS